MNPYVDPTSKGNSNSKAPKSKTKSPAQKKEIAEQSPKLIDNRPEAITQSKRQEVANNSPRVKQLKTFQDLANKRHLQSSPVQKKENNTGLPDQLKTGIENLSGHSMDDVKVHYNSNQPAQLNAHAYAQGTDIHLATGQEKHLPHEAWHVVQQKQGRVKTTMQMKSGVNINDDAHLEKEADVMGARALLKSQSTAASSMKNKTVAQPKTAIIQAVWAYVDDRNGEHLNLQTNADGTYTHSATGRQFALVRNGPPRIVRQIAGRRGTIRSRSQDMEEVAERDNPPSRRQRTQANSTSSPSLSQTTQEEGQVRHELTEEEHEQIRNARTYGYDSNGPSQNLYGGNHQSFSELACWNWALSGSDGNVVSPGPLFDMLGDNVHTQGNPLYQSTFNATWNHFSPPPGPCQNTYQQHRSEIRDLWQRRRGLRIRISRGSSSTPPPEIGQITNDAIRLSMQMNNLQPNESGQATPYSIAMARHPEQGINFSHWGLEVHGHSFETITDHGLWHQQQGFEYWAQHGPIEDSLVTRIPLTGLASGHVVGIRGLLNIMNSRQTTRGSRSSTSRGRRRRSARSSSSHTSRSSRAGGGQALPVIAPPAGPLDAGGMVMHYHRIIGQVHQATYSNEFHQVRDNPGAIIQLLHNGGMAVGAAQAFTQQFHTAVQHFGQQGVQYILPEMQEHILDTLGVQEQLLAVIRYLQQQQG